MRDAMRSTGIRIIVVSFALAAVATMVREVWW
jgi:hypothetical protein